ncbi:ATP-dependent nuclease [Xanthocytophaga flava]|uniref:ATP-dependent nuclease n=1 Tax=Xanthocytophaga flava TaxID=3048013 RepID=UPI0028D2E98F|nr:ATP-binding protein [Xanthocytophaga flavus]MDJ1468150.1 ATP-binding protein [Xanthocytophaga flavus]
MISIEKISIVDRGLFKKVCVLDELKHINVICGKNNSGKSTLLEAIQNVEKLQQMTLQIPIEELSSSILFHSKEEHRKGSTIYNNIVPELIENLKKADISYVSIQTGEENFYDFYNEISRLCGFLPLDRSSQQSLNSGVSIELIFANSPFDMFRFNLLKQVFLTIPIGTSHTFLMIPSKREPEISANLVNSIPSTFNFSKGNDLIYYLFYAKNQPTNNYLYKRYILLIQVFSEVSGGYNFDVNYFARDNAQKQLSLHLVFSSNTVADPNWYYADRASLGLRDLLVILSYIILLDSHIILLEEPESHLHAEVQRKLLGYFNRLKDKQFFITTHSNVFLDSNFVDRIFHTSIEDGGLKLKDTTNKAILLQDLGYSVFDNLVADLIILVEGPSDKPVLEDFLTKMDIWGKYNIKIWALGGDIMDKQDLKVFSESATVIALVDNDPGSDDKRKAFIENCQVVKIDAHRLKRYSIENYFTLEALRKELGERIPSDLSTIDPDKKLEKQINWDCKKSNRNIVRQMSLDDILGTDLYDFLEKVRKLCETKLPSIKA